MKKQGLFSMFAVTVALFAITSCSGGSIETKEVTLANQNDSLNYAWGLANGAQIKSMLPADSSNNVIDVFFKEMDATYKRNTGKDENYQLGYNFGTYMKQQAANGLMGMTDMKFDEKIFKQAVINGLRQYKEGGLTDEQANEFIERLMRKQQEEQMKMQQQMPQQAPGAGNESHEGHNHEGHEGHQH